MVSSFVRKSWMACGLSGFVIEGFLFGCFVVFYLFWSTGLVVLLLCYSAGVRLVFCLVGLFVVGSLGFGCSVAVWATRFPCSRDVFFLHLFATIGGFVSLVVG